MATLFRELELPVPPERVWEAARDVGALHTRLVPGFVLETTLDGTSRSVRFANGLVVRERIVSLDDARRRLAWTAEGGRTTHYNAVLSVSEAPGGCRVEWVIDLLPDDVAPAVAAMQAAALAAMEAAFSAAHSSL